MESVVKKYEKISSNTNESSSEDGNNSSIIEEEVNNHNSSDEESQEIEEDMGDWKLVSKLENIENLNINTIQQIKQNEMNIDYQRGVRNIPSTMYESNTDPYKFFELVITDEIVQSISDQTNLYAKQQIEKLEVKKYLKINRWHDTNPTFK